MGIKRTNANNMTSDLGGRVGNILYPHYTLINSHCYCNTRWRKIKMFNGIFRKLRVMECETR